MNVSNRQQQYKPDQRAENRQSMAQQQLNKYTHGEGEKGGG